MTDMRQALPGTRFRAGGVDMMRPEARHVFLALATRTLILISMMICIVVPHAFQAPTAALVVATALFALFGIRRSPWLDRLLALYCAGVAVTVLFVWIGYANGAPIVAVVQVSAIYIGAPLLWLLIG